MYSVNMSTAMINRNVLKSSRLFSSRPRPILYFFVVEAPRDQDDG